MRKRRPAEPSLQCSHLRRRPRKRQGTGGVGSGAVRIRNPTTIGLYNNPAECSARRRAYVSTNSRRDLRPKEQLQAVGAALAVLLSTTDTGGAFPGSRARVWRPRASVGRSGDTNAVHRSTSLRRSERTSDIHLQCRRPAGRNRTRRDGTAEGTSAVCLSTLLAIVVVAAAAVAGRWERMTFRRDGRRADTMLNTNRRATSNCSGAAAVKSRR